MGDLAAWLRPGGPWRAPLGYFPVKTFGVHGRPDRDECDGMKSIFGGLTGTVGH